MSQDDLPRMPITTSDSPSILYPVKSLWTWWEKLVVIVCVLAILGLAGVVVQNARYSGAKNRFKKQFAQLAAAIQQYEQQYGVFPPAYTLGKEGQRHHSWRTLLLPFIEQKELYQKLRLDEPWNSPHNSQFHGLRPEVFAHPWIADSLPGETHALAIVGPDTIWPEHYSAKPSDVKDGLSNSLLLMEYSQDEINWMEPRDLSRRDVLDKVFSESNAGLKTGKGVVAAVADGSPRFFSANINPKILSTMTSIAGGGRLSGVDWPPLPLLEMPPLRPVRPAAEFPGTEVVPILAAPLTAKKNLIYCVTLQIAWDQWLDSTGTQLKTDSDSPLVKELNLQRFDRGNLAQESYVAHGGRRDALPKILNERQNLGLNALPSEDFQAVPDEGFILYAALAKRLPFPIEFDRWNSPVLFKTGTTSSPVKSFGIFLDPKDNGRVTQMVEQVEIMDHLSDADFIAKLQTRGNKDEIYLAKIPPGETLGTTLQAAQKRVAEPAKNGFRKRIGEGDKFQIPDLELSIQKEFVELEGLPYRDTNNVEHSIHLATQSIQFRLDEKGTIVESEFLIVGDDGPASYDPKKVRKLVFDQPFLLWMQERGASAPYLVAWIANTEWMTPSP